MTQAHKLTAKEQLFVAAYPSTLCAAKAARAAGYALKGAQAQGKQLLKRPHIQAAIQAILQERCERFKVDGESVIAELRKIAFADPTMMFQVTAGKLVVQDTALMPEDLRRCISKISQTQHGLRIEFHDKTKALELLGRHLALFVDVVENKIIAKDPLVINVKTNANPGPDA